MMISDQDKQRIEEAARLRVSDVPKEFMAGAFHILKKRESFIAGASYEHPIAYNKALDDFDFILLQKEDYLHGEEGKLITELRKELQKMRK